MHLRLIAVILFGLVAPLVFGATLEPTEVPVPADIMASAYDFIATDGGLFILSTIMDGDRHEEYLHFVRFSDTGRPQRVPSRPTFLAKNLAGEALLVGGAKVETYSSTGVFLRSHPTALLADLAPLADGSYIGLATVTAGRQPVRRRRRTESEVRDMVSELGGDVAKYLEELGADGEKLKAFDVFHVGPDFAIISGILGIPKSSWSGRESAVPDTVLYSGILEGRYVRASPDGLHALAFKFHRPEIELLERRSGTWKSTRLPALTEGMKIPSAVAETFGLQDSPDNRMFYQSDVAVRASSLLIADPATRAILSVSFDGVMLDRYNVDALVAEMELSGNALYVRTRDRKMLRYELPPEAD